MTPEECFKKAEAFEDCAKSLQVAYDEYRSLGETFELKLESEALFAVAEHWRKLGKEKQS